MKRLCAFTAGHAPSWTALGLRALSLAALSAMALGLMALGVVIVVAGCSVPSEESVDEMLAKHATNPPVHGGTLNLGTVYVTLSALSWDTADWSWKQNHDTGGSYEQLFAADLDQRVGKGGAYPFRTEAWLPFEAMRGELAEHWEWEDPLTLVVTLRRGVMFSDKPGVMAARELDAHDVVFTYQRQKASPRKIANYFKHIDSVTAREDHVVVFSMSEYNAEWAYRFGYGYYSAIVPRELGDVDARDWRNVAGSGPFELERYIEGNLQHYSANPNYWDRESLDGTDYKIPFVDNVRYRVIKDEATYFTALRTAKIDILEPIRWLGVDYLKRSTPELRWSRWESGIGSFIVMRLDEKPFDDIRVRRALNLAINQQAIVDEFYGGNAEIMGYPMHTEFEGYYEPLEAMRPSVQELFGYDPDKARQLLAEAGYPDGFTFTMQMSTANPDQVDLAPLLVSYLADIGVTMKVEPMEYSAYLSTMTTRKHKSGYFLASGHTNPTTSLRKNFQTGQLWNASQYSNPEFDRRIEVLLGTRSEDERKRMVREMTQDILDEAPYVWLPTQYLYTAWWPWVKNYDGELRAGAVRPWPIYARIWIDQELKQEMGF